MDNYTATEQAYKNGYEQGKKDAMAEIVRCEDCKYWKSYGGSMKYYGECEGTSKDELWGEDDFCSHGERKDGEG